jgi:hypothetical protein
LTAQVAELKAAGCAEVFREKVGDRAEPSLPGVPTEGDRDHVARPVVETCDENNWQRYVCIFPVFRQLLRFADLSGSHFERQLIATSL